ncbi:MAG: fasciclin domain-containing protein [Pseudomonadota bacterium]
MPTIVDLAIGDDRFETLVQVLLKLDADPAFAESPDLVTTLSGGEFTVFAPTDDAFAATATLVAEGAGIAAPDTTDPEAVADFLITTLTAETVLDIILYHVASGTLLEDDVVGADGSDVATLLTDDDGPVPVGISLPSLVDREPDVVDPGLVQTNIIADNGVIHAIDGVLLPFDTPVLETLTGLVTADDGEFDILQKAVIAADLAGTLDDPAADFTVFAPVDAAFTNLATALGFSGDASDEDAVFDYLVDALTLFSGGGDPIPLLTNILLYHVSAGEQVLADVAAQGSIVPLFGDTITVDLSGPTLVDADPDLPDPGLLITDLQATNGVAHAISEVLIPLDLLPSTGANEVDFIIGDDDGSTFLTGIDNDFIDAKGGNDIVHAGRGDDVALGGAGNDIVTGNRGDDLLSGGDGHDLVRGQRGHDTLDGGNGDDFIAAGRGKDEVTGGHGEDTILGGNGKDTLNGGNGDDVIFGQLGRDVLSGGEGNDALNGGVAGDLIEGGAGHDDLFGLQGWDTLDGGEGNDFHITGRGRDVLIFREGDGDDTVLDFSTTFDKVDVSDFGFETFEDLQDADVIEAGFFTTRLDFGDDEMLLLGVFSSQLSADNFIFA